MIAGLSLWLRRGTPGRAVIALIAMHMAVMFSISDWWHEWDWAFDNATVAVSLTGPVMAGLVAHDRARRSGPSLDLLSAGSVRGRLGLLATAGAGTLAALAAWVIALVVAGVAAARDASGWPSPWIFGEGIALIMVCAAAGLAAGTLIESIIVGPLTAIVLFLGGMLLPSAGLDLTGILRVGGSTGSLIAISRTPEHAIALIVCHLCLTALFLAIAFSRPPYRRGRGRRRILALAAAAVVTLGSFVGLDRVSSAVDPYQWSGGPDVCQRGVVVVCGPSGGRYVIDAADESLSSAVTRLQPSGISWQRNYLIAHSHKMPADRARLSVDAESVHDGRLSNDTIAAALAAPRDCRGLLSDDTADPILKRQQIVSDWVRAQLGNSSPVSSAPDSVRTAYAKLQTCTPRTWLP